MGRTDGIQTGKQLPFDFQDFNYGFYYEVSILRSGFQAGSKMNEA